LGRVGEPSGGRPRVRTFARVDHLSNGAQSKHMSSNYTGDPSEFTDALSLMTDGDRPTAALFRVPLERLLDNAAYLKAVAQSSLSRQVTNLRATDASFTDTAARLRAVTLRGEENCAGPVLALKAGDAALSVYDHADTEDAPGGAIPNLTTITGAAVNEDGLIVVTGATTPFCAVREPGVSWAGGGNQIGGAADALAYSPHYGGFIAVRSTSAYRSVDGASWTSATAGASSMTAIAAIGAGAGNGVLVALSASGAPAVRTSSDDGATWGFSGSGIPNRLSADDTGGGLDSCPLVSRLGLNEYVYHVSRNDSGARLRTARTADGVVWASGVTIEAPGGLEFSARPRLLICKSTGVMVIVAPAENTADGDTFNLIYVSTNWTEWTQPATHKPVSTDTYALAGGKLLHSPDATMLAGAGFASGVLS
jgi:hypothetical protein